MTNSYTQPYGLLASLLKALYWLDESLQSRLENAGRQRLSFTKSMIMVNVLNGVTRPIELAHNLGVTRQAVHRTLQEMLDDKLIELRDDPKDKRAKIVAFNSASTEVMRDALKALDSIQKVLAERIGRRNLEQLLSILEKDWGPISTGKE